jgi:hypothetical protein
VVRRRPRSRKPQPQKEPGCFSPESKRGRWRARGAYSKYASTRATGIAKLSGEKHQAPASAILSACLAGAAGRVALGSTRFRLADVTGRAQRHAILAVRRDGRRRRGCLRRGGHAKHDAANHEAHVVAAAFDVRFDRLRDADDVAAAPLRLITQACQRRLVGAFAPVKTTPMTADRFDRAKVLGPGWRVVVTDFYRRGVWWDGRRSAAAGPESGDEQAAKHGPSPDHRGLVARASEPVKATAGVTTEAPALHRRRPPSSNARSPFRRRAVGC